MVAKDEVENDFFGSVVVQESLSLTPDVSSCPNVTPIIRPAFNDLEGGRTLLRCALIVMLLQAPKKRVSEVTRYVNKEQDELDMDESKWVSGIGVLCFVFGGLLLFIRPIVGAIVPPAAPRRPRASAQAPRKLFS